MVQRKVNWKNIKIIFVVTAFCISTGLIDRMVNQIKPIETLAMMFTLSSVKEAASPAWYNTTVTVNSMAASTFDPLGIIIIAIVGVAIMTCVVSAFSLGGSTW